MFHTRKLHGEHLACSDFPKQLIHHERSCRNRLFRHRLPQPSPIPRPWLGYGCNMGQPKNKQRHTQNNVYPRYFFFFFLFLLLFVLFTIFVLQRGLNKHIIQHGALNKKTLLLLGWFGKFCHGLEGLVGIKQTRGTCSKRLPSLSKQSSNN